MAFSFKGGFHCEVGIWHLPLRVHEYSFFRLLRGSADHQCLFLLAEYLIVVSPLVFGYIDGRKKRTRDLRI